MPIDSPKVMGIINYTPDSFFASSRNQSEEEVRNRVRRMVTDGADFIDLGAYSSRPGADDVTPQEEMRRLSVAMRVIREEAPSMPVSIDTFRADVARMSVEELGADIINDISGGEMDPDMFRTIAQLGVPYIMMHMQGTPQTMQQAPYYDNVTTEVIKYFAERIQRMRDLGCKDIILDPGYGFGKSIEHNYELLHNQHMLKQFDLPILAGISRKSMIYKVLETDPEHSLGGTTVLNTLCLLNGADILRVHDVAECKEVVKLINKYSSCYTSELLTL